MTANLMGLVRLFLAALLGLTLAACAGSPRESRFLRSLGDQAQPSDIVATELAFAREAREKGHWKAYANYAAEGAIVFDQNGPKPVSEYIAEGSGASGTFTWEVRQIFMSCDGSHAASMGTFAHSSGAQGVYTTIWQRQKKGDYRFILDFPLVGETWEDAGDMIRSTVGECRDTAPAARTQLFAPIRAEMDRDAAAKNIQMYQGISPDQSFAWFAGHASENDRGVMLGTFTDGRWRMMVGQREQAPDMMEAVRTPSIEPTAPRP